MQDPSNNDEIECVSDAEYSDHATARHSIQLETLPRSSKAAREDSATNNLLATERANDDRGKSRLASVKPFFLHPDTWMWEVLSLLGAFVILVAVAVVLGVYNGRPSPMLGGLTLNTIIAFAATLFRILLMVPVTACICQWAWIWMETGYRPLVDVAKFDAASRGPLGSLGLLIERGYGVRVSVAAFIVVVGIATAPFFQQSVVLYSATVPDTNNLNAFASAAFTYAGKVGDAGESWVLLGLDIPFNLKAAISSGVYSSSMASLPNPPYLCSTGNCTWDPFPTLGISVQCFENAKDYFLNCSEVEDKSWPGRPFRPCKMVDPFRITDYPPFMSPGINIEPTEGLVYTSLPGHVNSSPWNYTYAPYNTSAFDYGFSGDPSDRWSSINAGFAMFRWKLARNLLQFPSQRWRNSVITSESSIEAGYCMFYPSMQVIAAGVQNGIYNESIIYSSTEIEPYVHSDPTLARNGSHEIHLFDEGNITYMYRPPPCNATVSTQCPDEQQQQPVSITLPRRRYLNIMAAISMSLPLTNVSAGVQSGLFPSGQNGGAAEILYRAPNISSTMEAIAHYATIALRANDTILERQKHANGSNAATALSTDYVAPSHRVAGTVWVQTMHLHVRWAWLAFPAMLLLLATGLLFETIRMSRAQFIGVWKQNPLAVLLNTGWRPETDAMGAAATSRELEVVAGGLEARIVGTDEGKSGRRCVVVRKKMGRGDE